VDDLLGQSPQSFASNLWRGEEVSLSR